MKVAVSLALVVTSAVLGSEQLNQLARSTTAQLSMDLRSEIIDYLIDVDDYDFEQVRSLRYSSTEWLNAVKYRMILRYPPMMTDNDEWTEKVLCLRNPRICQCASLKISNLRNSRTRYLLLLTEASNMLFDLKDTRIESEAASSKRTIRCTVFSYRLPKGGREREWQMMVDPHGSSELDSIPVMKALDVIDERDVSQYCVHCRNGFRFGWAKLFQTTIKNSAENDRFTAEMTPDYFTVEHQSDHGGSSLSKTLKFAMQSANMLQDWPVPMIHSFAQRYRIFDIRPIIKEDVRFHRHEWEMVQSGCQNPANGEISAMVHVASLHQSFVLVVDPDVLALRLCLAVPSECIGITDSKLIWHVRGTHNSKVMDKSVFCLDTAALVRIGNVIDHQNQPCVLCEQNVSEARKNHGGGPMELIPDFCDLWVGYHRTPEDPTQVVCTLKMRIEQGPK